MKYLKTPLRYPGGKSRVAKRFVDQFPKDIQEYREPFIGGGSVALQFTQMYPEVPVWINDKYEYLYHFWTTLQENGSDLSDILVAIKEENSTEDKAKELFITSKEEIHTADPFRQAVLFWILNKCSYSGLTENSSFSATASKQNFTTRGAKNLKKISEIIQHWEITNDDYSDVMLDEGDGVFVFLDPPYMIDSFLYGTNAEMHKDFDHNRFIDTCKQCDHNWMVTYNNHDELKKAYEGYYQEEFRITYGMKHRADNRRKLEVMFANYDINPPTPLEVYIEQGV